MAVEAGLAVILVTWDSLVLAIHFTGRMTGEALEHPEIALIRVAIRALVPSSCMASAVNREVLVVMVKGRRHPGPLRMAKFTVCWESLGQVWWIGGRVVVIRVASVAGVWSCSVIPVVTQVAIPRDSDMGTLEGPVIAMDREGGRRPSGIGSMAVIAIRRDAYGNMVRIGSCIVGGFVTGVTCIRRSCIIAVMTEVAIGNIGMSPGEGVIVIVDRECGRGPARSGGVAVFAVRWYTDTYVVGIRSGIVCTLMTFKARIWSGGVVSIVALVTIGDIGMGTCQRIIVSMNGEGGRRPAGICSMAGFTCVRNTNSRMVGIGGLIVCIGVTIGTYC